MKKIKLLITIAVIALATSCRKDQAVNYHLTDNQLVSVLSSDKDYINLNNAIDSMASMNISRNRAIDTHPVLKSNSKADLKAYYTAKGYDDPDYYIMLKYRVFAYMFRLQKKYPQLVNMDKKKRSRIFLAATKPSSKQALQGILIQRKNNQISNN